MRPVRNFRSAWMFTWNMQEVPIFRLRSASSCLLLLNAALLIRIQLKALPNQVPSATAFWKLDRSFFTLAFILSKPNLIAFCWPSAFFLCSLNSCSFLPLISLVHSLQRANKHANKRIIYWPPFWNKVYYQHEKWPSTKCFCLQRTRSDKVRQYPQGRNRWPVLSSHSIENKDVLEGLGCLERPYHMELNLDVLPVVSPPRRIPCGLEGRVKAASDEMFDQGAIVPVNHTTDWVNAMVTVVKKNPDKLRISMEPRPLNKAIRREHYYLPTIEQITTRLSGTKYFSTLYARSGFW